jgi:molecular chaperone GrpE
MSEKEEELKQQEEALRQEEATTPTEGSEDTEAPANDEAKEGAEEQDPITKLEEQVKAEKDKYLRLYAEFENFRRRSAKERIDLIATSTGDLMKEILPVLDDFQRAVESNKKAEDIAAVKEGFDLLHAKLQRLLQAKGLKIIEAIGNDFDPDVHEAIAQIPAPEEQQKGKVIDVVEQGYTLNEKIIRHPKVVVGT